MAKAKKAVKKTAKKVKSAKRKGPTKMVWRIFKFFERYEYTHDSFKKKPLNYVKSFVGSGTDDISAEYFKQMQDLWLYDDYHILKNVFADIRDISANAGLIHRGYLLDGMHRPATNKLIGSWVKLDTKGAGQVLKKLEKVGLIEWVPLPDFDKIAPPEPDTPKPKNPPADSDKGGKIKPGKKRKKTGKKSEPLKNGKNGKTANGNPEGKTASGKRQSETESEKTAKGPKGQGETEDATPQPGHHPAADAAKDNGPQLRARSGTEGSQGNPDSNAEQPLPLLPTEADGPHSKAPVAADGSSTSTEADGGGSLTAGALVPGNAPPQHIPQPTFEQKYDSSCREFARAIFVAIRVMHSIGSPEGYRELAVFAQQWSYAQQSGIGDKQLGVLWCKAVAEATALGNKRRRQRFTKGPEAVWVTVFKSRLAKMVAEAGGSGGNKGSPGAVADVG